jgi:FlaA1/EpsC-like NDP-sugar epimerase
MGEAVKIDDLARKMIRLSGLEVREPKNPDGDIEIIYTGLRPAEKLYEELLISGNAVGTEHPRIWKAREARHVVGGHQQRYRGDQQGRACERLR